MSQYNAFLKETRDCLHCGIAYYPRDRATPQKYCTPFCRIKAQCKRHEVPRPEQPCEWCQKMFKPARVNNRPSRWCTPACRREAKNKPIVTKLCGHCGKEFETFRDRQYLCSEECGNIIAYWQVIQKYAHDPAFRADRLQKSRRNQLLRLANREAKCLSCEAPIEPTRKAIFCNQRCRIQLQRRVTPEEYQRLKNEAKAKMLPKSEPAPKNQSLWCRWCGDDFEGLTGEVYCSEDCQWEDASETMSDER